jgi:sulfate adenylyltransferase subunit 2
MNTTEYIRDLENTSIYIIREAYYRYGDKLAMLWSMGKDSTTMLHLARKAFLGKLPIKVIHIDTSFKFKEIYEFRDKIVKNWGLDLVITRNDKRLAKGLSPEKSKFDCCAALKTEALKDFIEKEHFKALLVGIRRDEHSIRAKERYFSQRDCDFKWSYKNQAPELWAEYYESQSQDEYHFRIHPLLHWREIDIWRYIKLEGLPIVNLYLAQKDKRYRSIGCQCCCQPVASKADTINKIIREIEKSSISERSGRAQDKENIYTMQKLRSLGYM